MQNVCRSLLVLVTLAYTGCVGRSYSMAAVELDPTRYQTLGPSEARSTGIMLFQLIPIGQNDKIERAVERAIREKGGTDMIDISVTESWFWAWVLNGYKIHVRGTVVRDLLETAGGAPAGGRERPGVPRSEPATGR